MSSHFILIPGEDKDPQDNLIDGIPYNEFVKKCNHYFDIGDYETYLSCIDKLWEYEFNNSPHCDVIY